jgi:outer membrane lipoprotein
MAQYFRRWLPIGMAALLAACASMPSELDVPGINTAVTPATAASDAAARGEAVRWGGVIVRSTNLKDRTELEVLAYPLASRSARPDTGAAAGPRFLVRHGGYLETVDYAAGREVTVLGTVRAPQAGSVGEVAYTYPVLEASRVYLWPKESRDDSGPRFHFGVGVGITR